MILRNREENNNKRKTNITTKTSKSILINGNNIKASLQSVPLKKFFNFHRYSEIVFVLIRFVLN